MAYIKIIEPDEASGDLDSIYKELLETRGRLAEVHKIHSLHPESMMRHMDLYMTIMYGKSPLKRWQRELIGVITSITNMCPYCITHHKEALNNYWKDNKRIERLIQNYRDADLSEADVELCNFTTMLTRSPKESSQQQIDILAKHGFSDRAILDATMITAYFNFVNRIVLGLGVNLEEDRSGYKY